MSIESVLEESLNFGKFQPFSQKDTATTVLSAAVEMSLQDKCTRLESRISKSISNAISNREHEQPKKSKIGLYSLFISRYLHIVKEIISEGVSCQSPKKAVGQRFLSM